MSEESTLSHGEIKGGIDELREFVLGGGAIFTLTNTQSGARHTYRVRRGWRKDVPNWENRFYADHLSGPDNTHDYEGLGVVWVEGDKVTFEARGRTGPDAPSRRGIEWLVSRLASRTPLNPTMKVFHEGRCGRCGRALTVPESIETGLGPVCAEKV